MSEQSTIIIIVILLVVVIIGTLIYILYRSNKPLSTATGVTGSSLPLFGQSCSFVTGNTNTNLLGSVGVCSSGLICLPNGVCVAGPNTPCTNINQCSPLSTTCSGLCLNGPVGGLLEYCPCDSPLLCVPNQSTGINLCLGPSGYSCTSSDQCVGQCVNNICQGGLAGGQECIGLECGSGLYCDPTGFCQPTGILSGQQGAFCNISPTAPVCDSPLVCQSGVCISTIYEVGANCTAPAETGLCNNYLNCEVMTSILGATASTNCIYPYNMACSIQSTCAPSYNCVSPLCIAQNNQPCVSNTNCVSGTCTSNNSLLYWNGASWSFVSTTPTDTYNQMITAYSTGASGATGITNAAPVYLLGGSFVRQYVPQTNTWTNISSTTISSAVNNIIIIEGILLDYENNLYFNLLHNNGTILYSTITDSNLNPISNFGTSDGSLIIGGTKQILSSASFDINQNIFVTIFGSGDVYQNTTYLNVSNASSIQAYGTNPYVTNYAYIDSTTGPAKVIAVGELQNLQFPLFLINGQDWIAQTYSIFGTDSAFYEGPTGGTGATFINCTAMPGTTGCTFSFNPIKSYVYTIARASSATNTYAIVVNNGTYQSELPGYIGEDTLIATNGTDTYLFVTNICQ